MGALDGFAKQRVLAVQEFTLLAGRAFRNIFRPPHYFADIVQQMDFIGFGSLPIVILTGFFTGAVLALQMANTLTT
ncbi:MAG: ABC transporter permease, partial [Acidobacteria bacterium]|nr:ABC transporter permease [Acidobacteriota bacterium]